MKSHFTYTDVAGDPCAIIARTSCGTVIFFASYALTALNNGNMENGFWLSLCLGLMGCMAAGRKTPERPV